MMVTPASPPAGMGQGPYLRLALLFGQALALGMTLSLLVVVGNALFLTDFGAQALPFVYLVVAAAGVLLSVGLAAAQRRWSLAQLALATVGGLALFYLLCWLALTSFQARWVSFALLVSFALVIRLGFVFLGAQAGRLFDVRQIKRLFPQIVAGFVMGFIVGALAIPTVVDLLGSPENAVVALVVPTLAWLAGLLATYRRFPAELARVEPGTRALPATGLPQLLRHRFVLLIFGYQVLTAMAVQLSDFILATLVGERYGTSQAIAQFFSRFTAVLNGTDLVFVMLIAGYFLSRFGLGPGLLAHPVTMGALMAGMAIAGPTLGTGSLVFFGLAVVAQIANISLMDGMTRGATNAAYQVLPAEQRVPVQAGVESLGGPLALGIVGIILLVMHAVPGLTVLHLVYLSLLILGLWGLVGVLVYRDYAGSLLRAMRRRALGAGELSLDDAGSLGVVTRLLDSARPADVALALDLLAAADHPALDQHLLRLVADGRGHVRGEALAHIERRRLSAALPWVQRLALSEDDPPARGAALRALCALLEADAVELVKPCLTGEQPEARLGALVGLLRYGGISGVLAAGEGLLEMARSPDPAARALSAEAIGAVAAPDLYQPLLALLGDPDDKVRRAALVAAGQVRHPRLLPLVVGCLARPATRSAAASTLVAYGERLLPLVALALKDPAPAEPQTVVRLARAAGQVGGQAATEVLKPHLAHPVEAVRGQVLHALHACDYRAAGPDAAAVEQAIRVEAQHCLRWLEAGRDVGQVAEAAVLQQALDQERDQARHRLFQLLGCLYDRRAIMQAEAQLAVQDGPARALALELLEVMLPAPHKGMVLPVLDPGLAPAERLRRLQQVFGAISLGRDERLRQLIVGAGDPWPQPWTRACALYAAARLRCFPGPEVFEAHQADPDPVVRETAAWALGTLTA